MSLDTIARLKVTLDEVKPTVLRRNSGGPWGYVELLQARADPKHERHAECDQWFADGFDPEIST
jgi:hypothetical protein